MHPDNIMGRVKKRKTKQEIEDEKKQDHSVDSPTGEGKVVADNIDVKELFQPGEETQDKNQKLAEIYYSPRGYWKGRRAVEKLHEATSRPKKEILEWLEKQAIYQIYKPAPAYISRNKFHEDRPNAVHQADLLYLPEDKVGRTTYRYCLIVVDVASRYKDAHPLAVRTSNAVAEGLTTIYTRGPLDWPNLIQIDGGSEFKGVVKSLAARRGTFFRVGDRGNHRQQSIVERFNRTISERIFAAQYHDELKDSSKRSKRWVEALPHLIEDLNDTVTRLTGKKPVDAIKEEKVESKPASPPLSTNLDPLEPSDIVRYLYAPAELEGWSKRATDPIWSLTTHHIKSVNDQGVYWLGPDIKHGSEPPTRSFVRAELLLIPLETQL